MENPTDRELLLLIHKSLEGLAESAGRDIGQIKQQLETIDQNVDLVRAEVKALSSMVRASDYMANDAHAELEKRVAKLEKKSRAMSNGNGQ